MTFEMRGCQGNVPSLQWTRQRARFSKSLLRAVHPRWASLKRVEFEKKQTPHLLKYSIVPSCAFRGSGFSSLCAFSSP